MDTASHAASVAKNDLFLLRFSSSDRRCCAIVGSIPARFTAVEGPSLAALAFALHTEHREGSGTNARSVD
jgi:hypothetical protein